MIPPNANEFQKNGNGDVDNNDSPNGSLIPVSGQPSQTISSAWEDPFSGMGMGEMNAADEGFNPMALVRALRRRWLIATVIASTMALTTVIVLRLTVPISHTVKGLILVGRNENEVLGKRKQMANNADYLVFKQTQIEVIKRSQVLQGALNREGIPQLSLVRKEKDALEWLKDNLEVEYGVNSEVLHIWMKGEKPDELAQIVNAVMRTYLDEVVTEKGRQQNKRIDTLEKQRRDNTNQLRQKRIELKDLRRIGNVTGSEEAKIKLNLQLNELNSLRAQKAQFTQMLHNANYELEVMKLAFNQRLAGLKPTPGNIRGFLQRDPEYQQFERQYKSLKGQYDFLARGLKNPAKSPTLRPIADNIDFLKVMMGKRRTEVIRLMRDAFKSAQSDPSMRAAVLKLNSLVAQFKQAQEQFGKLKTEVDSLTSDTETMESLDDAIKMHVEYVADFTTQINQLNIERNAQERIRELEPAYKPKTDDAVQKWLLFIAAGVIVFGIGLVGVGLWEYLSKRVGMVEDVSERLGMEIIGTVPALTSRNRNGSLETMLIDSMDNIRTSLIHGTNAGQHRVIMVTSGQYGEGKTTVASQMAVSLARAGRRTLVIDGDLRKPSLNDLFEMPLSPGLSEVLTGTVELEDAIQPTQAEDLSLLSAGLCDYAVIQALAGNGLSRIFDHLKTQFDFIVIDSEPALVSADTLLMGQHVDVAILSVRLDHSRSTHVRDAERRLQKVGIPVLGCIINGAKQAPSHSQIELQLTGPE